MADNIKTILTLTAIILGLVILFSPVTYSLANRLYKKIKTSFKKSSSEEEKISAMQEIQIAVETLVSVGKGATIIIDVKNETNEYVTGSQLLDSRITSDLLVNIFEGSKTPLHDGAVIIKDNRIDRASAYITNLSAQKTLQKFGTRHRSALGLSEVTRAIIIVISEESGQVRVFFKGKWEEVPERELFGRIITLWS